jgi:hypothetical protein
MLQQECLVLEPFHPFRTSTPEYNKWEQATHLLSFSAATAPQLTSTDGERIVGRACPKGARIRQGVSTVLFPSIRQNEAAEHNGAEQSCRSYVDSLPV